MALGSLIIKEKLGLSDIETVEQIKENPYLQFFISLETYQHAALFDASMLTHFHKRLKHTDLGALQDYPMAPAVLAIVLGPLAEPSLRQSLLVSDGDISVFFTRPISGTFMAIAILLLVMPMVQAMRRRMKAART